MSQETAGANAEPPILSAVVCPTCGAANYAHAENCFLCRAPMVKGRLNPYAEAGQVKPVAQQVANVQEALSPTQKRIERLILIALVVVVALAVLVGIGIGTQDQGVLVLYLIVLVPSLTAAGLRGALSALKGEEVRPSKMLTTFIVSMVVTMGLGALLVVCGVIFLLMMCAQMLNGH